MRAAVLLSLSLMHIYASEVTDVLRYASSSPEMRTFVSQWRGQGEQLLAQIAVADMQQRRAAALIIGELGADSGITPSALLTALSNQSDAETISWASRGLIGRLQDISADSILALRDRASVITLLSAHPDVAIMEDKAVLRFVTDLLAQEAWCEMVVMLVVARGTTATYGPVLLEALTTVSKKASPSQVVLVQILHQGLSLLTNNQRGLSAYAGHYDLLIKDWSDALASIKPSTLYAEDPRIAALIKRLPEQTAIMELLSVGAPALQHIELAMVGASKDRRRDLDKAARLLARSVSPIIYQTLGDEGLRDLDAERVADRLELLKRVVDVVSEKHDAAGVRHLLAWSDDRDATVRAAALDRLVRLSDSKKEFKLTWTLSDVGLFPPASSRWRIRKAITKGTTDEQIAALLLTASLSAKDLQDDVAGLLFSPSIMVAETAIETLGHLRSSDHNESLVRLALDDKQSLSLRLKSLDLIEKNSDSSSDEKNRQRKEMLIKKLTEAAKTDDPTLRTAFLKAQFALQKDDTQTRAVLSSLLSGPIADQRIGLMLLASRPNGNNSRGNATGTGPVIFVDLALPFLTQSNQQDLVDGAIAALVAGLRNSSARSGVLTLFTDQHRQQVTGLIKHSALTTANLLTLSIATGAISHSEAIGYFKKVPIDDWYSPWREFVRGTNSVTAIIDAALILQTPENPLEDYLVDITLNRVLSEALLTPKLLPAVLSVGDFSLLSDDNDSDYGTVRTTTIKLSQNRTLVVVGKNKAKDDIFSSDRYDWSVQGKVPSAPLPIDLQAWAEQLELLVTKKKQSKRDVILSLLRNESPPQDIAIDVENDLKIWRLIMVRDSSVRERVVAAINSDANFSTYRLQEVIEPGKSDLLPAVVRALAMADDDYDVRRYSGYLASLPVSAIEPLITELLKNSFVANNEGVQKILRAIGKIPLAGAVQILQQGSVLPGVVMPYESEDMIRLKQVFAGLEPNQLLNGIATLRAIRSAVPIIFDEMMQREANRQDAVGAAWLRTGLPLMAGMRILYVQALQSRQTDVWLVGAAIGLQEERLTPSEFIEKLPQLSESGLLDAAIVAKRYMKNKMEPHGEALAQLITRASPRVLAAWLPVVPPSNYIAKVLADLVRDPVLADQLGFILVTCLRADKVGWTKVLEVIAPQANGRLDYLLPAR